MRLNREVGDLWMVAIGHNNLGNARASARRLRRGAAHYTAGLRIYRDYGDRWALAFLLEDVAVLAALTGDPSRALELIGAADSLREEIGAPRAPSLQEEIDEQLAPARTQLRGPEAEAALAKGRALTLDDGVGVALELCALA